MKIAFIGTGVMGEAIIAALIKQKIVQPSAINTFDVDAARLSAIAKKYKVNPATDMKSAVRSCDIVVLAIKPQVLAKVMDSLKGYLKKTQLVLSIVAGASLETLSTGLKHDAVVRVGPNTPAQVGQGISVWIATDAVTSAQKKNTQTILAAMGKEVYLSDEKSMNMATAISGCGPAYIFLIMEALADAGVHIGLPRNLADELVTQTVLGSAYLARESGKHPAELKNMVSTPGGITVEGLLHLEKGGTRAIIAEAVIAAYEKAQLRGGQIGK